MIFNIAGEFTFTDIAILGIHSQTHIALLTVLIITHFGKCKEVVEKTEYGPNKCSSF